MYSDGKLFFGKWRTLFYLAANQSDTSPAGAGTVNRSYLLQVAHLLATTEVL